MLFVPTFEHCLIDMKNFELIFNFIDTVFKIVLVITALDIFSFLGPVAVFASNYGVWAFIFNVCFKIFNITKTFGRTFSICAL